MGRAVKGKVNSPAFFEMGNDCWNTFVSKKQQLNSDKIRCLLSQIHNYIYGRWGVGGG